MPTATIHHLRAIVARPETARIEPAPWEREAPADRLDPFRLWALSMTPFALWMILGLSITAAMLGGRRDR